MDKLSLDVWEVLAVDVNNYLLERYRLRVEIRTKTGYIVNEVLQLGRPNWVYSEIKKIPGIETVRIEWVDNLHDSGSEKKAKLQLQT